MYIRVTILNYQHRTEEESGIVTATLLFYLPASNINIDVSERNRGTLPDQPMCFNPKINSEYDINGKICDLSQTQENMHSFA